MSPDPRRRSSTSRALRQTAARLHVPLLALGSILRGAPPQSAFSTIVLDASNLQLGFRPDLKNLRSKEVQIFPQKLDALAKLLGAEETYAIFDGKAYGGAAAGKSWDAEPEQDGEKPVHIQFTQNPVKHEDIIYKLALDATGSKAGMYAAKEEVTAEEALAELDKGWDALSGNPPIFEATMKKRTAGKYKKALKKKFMESLGIFKFSDMAHMLSLTEMQYLRTCDNMRGIRNYPPGRVTVKKFTEKPSVVVVTDDRSLRLRCASLPKPPVVMRSRQFTKFINKLKKAQAAA